MCEATIRELRVEFEPPIEEEYLAQINSYAVLTILERISLGLACSGNESDIQNSHQLSLSLTVATEGCGVFRA